jgi:hypothetical protein
MNLEQLQKIEDKMGEIRELLNPEDSPYVCDTIVANINDEMLIDLVMDMLIHMGYKNKKILEVSRIIEQIQSNNN